MTGPNSTEVGALMAGAPTGATPLPETDTLTGFWLAALLVMVMVPLAHFSLPPSRHARLGPVNR
jgi:hypothetical protein